MSKYSVTDVSNMTGRNLGESNATQAVNVEGVVTTSSTTLKESYTGNTTTTYNVTGNYIEIDNQGLETITLTVDGLSIPIKAGYIFYSTFTPFLSFTLNIPTTCDYQVLVGE